MKKTSIAIVVIVFFVIVGSLVVVGLQDKILVEISNFEECAVAGYLIMESYPRYCRMPDGRIFLEDIGNVLEKENLIRVKTPRPNEAISSPLLVYGEARGFWFFEADFPIKLLDGKNVLISLEPSFVITSEEWKTEDFVSFSSSHTFEVPITATGTLIFCKDEPSLSECSETLHFPVKFN